MKNTVYNYGKINEKECGHNGRYEIIYTDQEQDSALCTGFDPTGEFSKSIMEGIGYIADNELSTYNGKHTLQALSPEAPTIIGVIEQVSLIETDGVYALHIVYRGLQLHQEDAYPIYLPRLQLDSDSPNVYAIDVLHHRPDESPQTQTKILTPKENEQDKPIEVAMKTTKRYAKCRRHWRRHYYSHH